MKNRSFLLRAIAAACLMAAWPRLAVAYVDVTPPTLGALCNDSVNIYVLQVEKASAEKGVILFKCVEVLKGKSDPTAGKHVIPTAIAVGGEKSTTATDVAGPKMILDWATQGKSAVLFTVTRGGDPGGDVKGVGHAYIDNYWYTLSYNREGKCWAAFKSELGLLTRYCGPADKLAEAVAKILNGEQVVVKAMAGDNRQELLQRRAKVEDVRASLQLLDDPRHQKKPDDKKPEPGDKKSGVRTPDRVGTVQAVAADDQSFTLQPAPTEKDKEPALIEIQIRAGTLIMAGKEPGKLAVGQSVNVRFAKGTGNVAAAIQIGKLPENPEKKPTSEPKAKKPGAPEQKPAAGDKAVRESN
jgi:hypothetical protein